MRLRLIRVLLAIAIITPQLSYAQEADSLHYVSVVDQKPLQASLGVMTPLVLYDLMHYKDDASIASMRNHYLPNHQTKWAGFTQYLPLATAWGLRIAGVEGRSESHWEALTAHAITYTLGAGITLGGKELIGRVRPDGSADNSFPSGHTMTAFAGAAILDAEYGAEYPWLSAIGYAVATTTGVGRILNNRHWATDVITGAGVGIASAYLGYLLNDLLWGRGLECYELQVSRELHESPAYVRMEKGYHTILSGVSDYKYSGLGTSVGITARIPLYKEWGIRAIGRLLESNDHLSEESLHGWSALLAADYMRARWGGRVWLEGHIGLGYISEVRLSEGTLGQARSESIPMIAPSLPLNIGLGAMILATDRLGVGFNASYWYAPTAHGYDLSNRKGLSGLELGIGLSYVFD